MRRARAFTLIELLVVIGIIVVMTALSIPAIYKFMDGQALTQSGRLVQSAFNEARRAAITQRARQYLVFFRQKDPKGGNSFLWGTQRYSERKGYEGEAQLILRGVRFDLRGSGGTGGGGGIGAGNPGPGTDWTTRTNWRDRIVGRIQGIGAVVFDELPPDNHADLFGGDDRRPTDVTGWIEFRRDGTINLRNLSGKIPPEIQGASLFDLNVPIELGQTAFDQLAGAGGGEPEVDMNLRADQERDVDKRCFIDIDPNTGRLNFRELQVLQ